MKMFWTLFWRMGLLILLLTQPIGYLVFFIYDFLPVLGAVGVKIKPTITYAIYAILFLSFSTDSLAKLRSFLMAGSSQLLTRSKLIFKTYCIVFFMLALINLLIVVVFSEIFWVNTRLLLPLIVFLVPLLFVGNKKISLN
jgi:intracellular septation protein A